jgi:hypothetical protein
MLDALEELREPNTFFLKKFFAKQVECPSESVDIDIYKGKRRVAVYVNPRAVGQTVDRIGYTTYTYKPPYLKPKMATTAEDILKRQPGEILYSNNLSNEQRAAQQMAKDMAELDGIITRAEELQAKQALFDSLVEVHDIDGNDVVADITFPRESTHTVDLTATGETAWDATGANPLEDLRTWKRLNIKDSGIASDIVVMGSDAANEFLKNSYVMDALDNRKYELGNILMEAQELGVTYIGRIEGVDIYAYDEWYVEPSTGTETEMVPAKKVLVGSTRARCERVYGAIRDIEAGLAAVARYPKSWIEQDPSVRWIQIHSAPLLVPVQVDAFTVATVLA